MFANAAPANRVIMPLSYYKILRVQCLFWERFIPSNPSSGGTNEHQRIRESMIMVDKYSMHMIKLDNLLSGDYHIHVWFIYHCPALTNS